MSNREIVFEGGWVVQNTASMRLRQKGYSAAGWDSNGQAEYALYRWDEGKDKKYTLVCRFNTPEELNNMVKLLLDE